MSAESIAYAQAYYWAGLSVLPTVNKKGAKKWPPGAPRMTDQEIEQWWTDHPEHQVAIITGAESGGVIVLDVDDAAALDLLKSRGFPLNTPWQTVTGKGFHFGFRAPQGVHIQNKTWIFGRDKPQVDVRGERGIIVMPPSVHHTGRKYEWLVDGDEDFDLLDVIDNLPELPMAWFKKQGIDIVGVPRSAQFSDNLDWEKEDEGGDLANARRWLAVQAPSVQGQKGQDRTFAVCAKLTRDYGLTLKQAWALIQPWNASCLPPWEPDDLRRKLEEAFMHGKVDRMQDDPMRKALEARFGTPVSDDANEDDSFQQEDAPDDSQTTPSAPANKAGGLLAKLAASREAAHALEHKAEKTEPTEPAQVAQHYTDAEDEQYMREVSAEAASDPGYVFRADILERCASIERDKPHVFFRFESDLRRVVNHTEWKRLRRNKLKELAATKKVTQLGTANAERPEVRITGDEKEVRDQLIKILEVEDGVYVYGGHLSYLVIEKRTNNEQMVDLEGGKMRNLLCDVCKSVQPQEADGVTINKPTPMPANILQMLEDMLPEQLARFKNVTRLVKAPFFLPNGTMITEPGYEETTGTLLVECPKVDLDRFQTTASAVEYLRNLFSTFPFESEADFANYIGALLTVMCRSMYEGATPWLLIQANMPSSGKSLLGELVQLLYGYTPVKSKLPVKEEELEKALLSLLVQAKPIIMFDNVKHVIESAALELLGTTGDIYEARVLGATATRKCPVRQLFILTSNNATMSLDSARRFLSVRLLKREEIKLGQAQRWPDIRAIVQDNRAEILSALCRMVHDWVHRESFDLDASVPSINSYEAFSAVVGGICYHAGLDQWAGNFEKSMREFSMHEELGPFLFAWWERFNNKKVSVTDLVNLANAEKMLGAWMGKSTDISDRTASFRKRLAEKRDLAYSGFVIKHEVDARQTLKFYLDRTEDNQSHTIN